jgi:hypothetical protein
MTRFEKYWGIHTGKGLARKYSVFQKDLYKFESL